MAGELALGAALPRAHRFFVVYYKNLTSPKLQDWPHQPARFEDNNLGLYL